MNQNNFRGICTYLDGSCNTLAGKDHSKLYMENLAYRRVDSDYNISPIYWFQRTSGNSSDNPQHQWNGDFLKLGTNMGYPIAYYDDITIEMVLKLGTGARSQTMRLYDMTNTTTVNDGPSLTAHRYETEFSYAWRLDSAQTSGGHSISVPDEDAFTADLPHHIMVVHRLGSYVRLYVDGVLKDEEIPDSKYTAANGYSLQYPGSKEQGVDNQGFYKYLVGIGSQSIPTQNDPTSSGASSIISAFDFYLGLLRVYNYPLTAEEITANWEECKSRFGIL